MTERGQNEVRGNKEWKDDKPAFKAKLLSFSSLDGWTYMNLR